MTEKFQPVFNFDDSTPLTPADEVEALLAEADAPRSSGGKVFRPGSYDIKVLDVIPRGPAKSDNRWMSVRIVLGGMGDHSSKTISTFLLIPCTNVLTYLNREGKKSIFPFKNFTETLGAFGIEVTRETAKDIVLQYFSPQNLGVLVGREAKATVGYRAAHAKYIKEGEEGYVGIVDGSELVKDTSGNVVKFTGDDAYAAAEEYAKTNGLRYSAFPDVLSLETAGISNDNAGNW